MSTSLGRLVLDMAANAAGFERDMQRISKSAQRELNKVQRDLRFAQRDLDKARRQVTMLGTAMVAVGGIALTGAVRQFRQMSNEADRIGKLGIQLGISAEAVQELGFAAEQSGSNMEQFSKGLVQMQRNIQSANDGLATQQRAFARMGIEVEKLRGLSPDQQFELIADALSRMEDETQRNASALEIFGRSASNLLPLINSGAEGIERLREQMRATGSVMSQEAVDAAQKFNDAINVLTKQLNEFKVTLFSDVIQTVAAYADWLANTEEGQMLFADLLKQIGETAKTVGLIIGVGFTGALVKAIGTMILAEIRVARLTQQKLALAGASRTAAIGVTLFGRAVSIATGPLGIAVAVLGTLYLGYRSVKSAAEDTIGSIDQFGQSTESTADIVARLTGNINELRRSEIQRAFEGMKIQAIEARQRIVELDQELQRIRDQEDATGFLNPAAIDIDAGIEDQRAKYLELAAAMGELKEAYTGVGQAASGSSDGIDEAGKAAQNSLGEIQRFIASLEDLSDQLEGGNAGAVRTFSRQIAAVSQLLAQGRIDIETYVTALRLYQRELKKATRDDSNDLPLVDMRKYIDLLEDAKGQMQEMASIEFGVENLAASFSPLADEMLRLGDAVKFVDDALNEGVISNAEAGILKFGAASNAAFNAMKSGVDSASKEYKQLEKAQQITNTALGIAAILQQGMGDPYTAIPRMIAMAAMVASLGVNTGGVSGGASSQQQQQGTGTVLGDTEAKSESIVNSMKIVADATSALVGINRAQLRAIQAMSDAITGATTSIARGGIDDVAIPSVGSTSFLDGLFGFNKTKIKDQGIELFGGTLAEIIDQGIGQAFVRVKKKGLFRSKKKTGFDDLADEVTSQIELLLGSMVDAVRAGAQALGMLDADIQQAIDAFEVESQRISLLDLSAEEQQAELEAIFSSIFDGLAGAVVPFIAQFQQVGEGLGETLIRVATGVQVTQEAMKRLGFALDETDPEKFAQASEGLLAVTGGIEGLIAGMGRFVDKFASDAVKFEIAQSDLNRAMEQAGLSVPATRDAMWELMQTMDATTEEGRRQIATLLELSDAADTYYNRLEEIQSEREGLERRMLELAGDTVALRALELEKLDESNRGLQERIWALKDEAELLGFMADVNADLLDILAPTYGEFNKLVQTMQAQRETAERLGASEQQMMMLRALHQAQMNQFVAGLQESIRTLTEQLFGGGGIDGSLEQTASSVSDSMGSIRDSMISALKNVQDWLDRQLLGPTSTLTPQEKLNEAQSQFDQAIAAALGGDVSAMSDLPGLADQLLGFGSTFFGTSTNAFGDMESQVRAAMESVAGMMPPGFDQPPTFSQTANIETATAATAASAFEQAQIAGSLLEQIALLSRITGDAPSDIGEEFGIPIAELIAKITGELPDLTGDALSTYFDDLATGFDDEISVLLDSKAIQNAQLEALTHIEFALRRIAERHDLMPDIGPGRGDIANPGNTIADALHEDGQSTREELRAIREELERISDQTGQGNQDRRALIGATDGVNQTVRQSGDQTRQEIRNARTQRRGVGA